MDNVGPIADRSGSSQLASNTQGWPEVASDQPLLSAADDPGQLEQPAAENLPIEIGDADETNEERHADAIEAFLSSEDGQLNAGDPPRLTRKQKQARKGLPKPENLRRLARCWLASAHRL